MNPMTYRYTALMLSIAAISASGTFAQEGIAETSAEQALDNDARSYSRDYGVNVDEAKRRLLIMANSGPEIGTLEQQLGDSLSGSYFENKGDFKLVVRTVGSTKRSKQNLRVKRKTAPSLDAGGTDLTLPVEFVEGATLSKRVVKSLLKNNHRSLKSIVPSVQGVGYDEEQGSISILARGNVAEAPAIKGKEAELEKLYKMPVTITVAEVTTGTRAMRGGSALYLSDGTPWCTSAFAAKNPSAQSGMLTAGHCDDPQFWREGTTSYPLSFTDQWNGWADYGFLRGSVTVEPKFVANNGDVRTLTGRRTKSTTQDRLTATADTKGTYVCFYGRKSGPTYGQSCGEVNDLWYNPDYAINTPSGQYGCSNGPTAITCEFNYVEVVQSGTTQMNCIGGDSGAPVFIYTVAFGVLSGCSNYTDGLGNPMPRAYSFIYSSMDDIYYDGYSLIYG